MRLGGSVARYGGEHSGGTGRGSAARSEKLEPDDHDFGGLYQSGDGLAFFQAQFANRVGGDDGGNALAADGEGHLRDQAVNFYVGDTADELVAAADAAKVCASFGDVAVFGGAIQETVHFFFRNAVVAAGGFYGANFLFVDPLFQRGIADSEHLCGVAGREEFRGGHLDSPKESGRVRMLSATRRGCQSDGAGGREICSGGNAERERRSPVSLARSGDLRQVVTNRRKHHVVQPVRPDSIARRVHTGPGVALDVGVLTSELEATLRSVVKALPEAEGAFKDVLGIAIAIR